MAAQYNTLFITVSNTILEDFNLVRINIWNKVNLMIKNSNLINRISIKNIFIIKFKDFNNLLTNLCKNEKVIKALNWSCSYFFYYVTNFTSDCDWLVDVIWLHSKHIIGPNSREVTKEEGVWWHMYDHKLNKTQWQ